MADADDPKDATKLTNEQEALFEEAVRTYGPGCLWNCKPSRTRVGFLVVAEKLKAHGNMRAWRLAIRMEESVGTTAAPTPEET